MRITIPTLEVNHKYHQSIFTFNASKRHHWLQKICFRILGKLGCYWIEPMTKTNYIDIESDDIFDLILQARTTHMRLLRDEIRYAIIGTHEFDKLVCEFYVKIPYHIPRYTDDTNYHVREISSFLNMQVIIVPWFHGVLLLPEITEKGIRYGHANNGLSFSPGYDRPGRV